MKRLPWFVAVVLAALASGSARAGDAPLTICAEAVPTSFDPASAIAVSALPIGPAQIFDRLVGLGPDGIAVEPRLARWWDVSQGGREYTFRLRGGVTFHANDDFQPIRDFAAADVVFTFRRLIEPDQPFAPDPGAQTHGLARLVTAVEAVEDDLVRFTLSRPDSSFLYLLAMDFASIQSAEYADLLAASGDEPVRALAAKPVGTGPFRLASAEPGAIELAAHAGYWDGAPASASLTVRAMPDAADRFAGLRDGACAAAVSPDALDIDALERGGTRIVRLPQTAVVYLAFDTARPAVADAARRRALAAALDRAALAATVGFGAVPATRLTPPAPGDSGETPDYGDSRAPASSEAAADLPPLTLLTPTSTESRAPDALSLAISEMWRAAGRKVEIETVTWDGYPGALSQGAYDAVVAGFDPDTPDDGLTLASLLGCASIGTTNAARWCDHGFDRLLEQAGTATDPVRRSAALEAARAVIAREMPAYPLLRPTVAVALAPGVEGLDAASLTKGDFREARIADNQPETP